MIIERFFLLTVMLVMASTTTYANGESPKTEKVPTPAKAEEPAKPENALEAAEATANPAPPAEPAIPEVANSAPVTPPPPEQLESSDDGAISNNEPNKPENNSKDMERIARSIVTSAIEEREPTDDLSNVPNNLKKVFYFSELVDLKGEEVVHRWLYKDKVRAEVKFQVGGERWRVYSSKNLLASWTGTWTVQVALADGTVLESKTFDLVETEEEPQPEAVGQLDAQ